MYDDFKSLNYWKTTRKLDKLDTLISRMRADAVIKSNRIDNLIKSVKILNNKMNDHTQFTNPFISTTPVPEGPAYIKFRITDLNYVDIPGVSGSVYEGLVGEFYDEAILLGNINDLIPVIPGDRDLSVFGVPPGHGWHFFIVFYDYGLGFYWNYCQLSSGVTYDFPISNYPD